MQLLIGPKRAEKEKYEAHIEDAARADSPNVGDSDDDWKSEFKANEVCNSDRFDDTSKT